MPAGTGVYEEFGELCGKRHGIPTCPTFLESPENLLKQSRIFVTLRKRRTLVPPQLCEKESARGACRDWCL